METKKFDFLFKKGRKWIFTCVSAEITLALSISVLLTPTVVFGTSIERSSQVAISYSMETQKFYFYFQKRSKMNFDLCQSDSSSPKIHQIQSYSSNWSSIERSSRVLQHENPKFWFSFQKRSKLNFDSWHHPCFVNNV